jgi:hypothetical protein
MPDASTIRAMADAFATEFTVPLGPETVLGDAMREFVPFFGRHKYQVTSQGPDGLTLTRRYLSGWAFLGGLITFPLGILVWALARRTQTVAFTFSALPTGGTRIVVSGQGPSEVQAYVSALGEHARQPVAAA